MPIAPGTFGTLAAIPLWWWLAPLPLWVGAATTLLLIVLSVWISARAERIHGGHDSGKIVIDEVVGMLVTVIGVPFDWSLVVTAFFLFRALDIIKPQPIRWVDKNVPGGLGVVLDDVAAGVVGCALLHGAHWLAGGWW
jgi:phosphatidylglycerophosphatase A